MYVLLLRYFQWNLFPIFIFSKHQPSGPILSKSGNVHPCARLFTFEVPFKRLFAPTSKSWVSNFFLEIQNSWEKGIEESGLRFENFY